MRLQTVLALCVAILLPLIGYLLVKHYSDNAVIMPRRYYEDSVLTKIVDGKEVTDTVWHQVKNISLTNQLGQNVSLDDVKGKVIVADFFFTRCPSICPRMTKNMKLLQDALKLKDQKRMIDSTFIQFISFTVDPEHDSASVLKKYADRFNVNPDTWWMLTGPKQKIYDFAFEELKVDKYNNDPVDTGFVHTSRFTLLDRDRVVRGYYDGLDSASLDKLAKDIVFIMLEKDRKKPSALFEKIKALWPIFIIVVVAVIVFVVINSRNNLKPNY